MKPNTHDTWHYYIDSLYGYEDSGISTSLPDWVAIAKLQERFPLAYIVVDNR